MLRRIKKARTWSAAWGTISTMVLALASTVVQVLAL